MVKKIEPKPSKEKEAQGKLFELEGEEKAKEAKAPTRKSPALPAPSSLAPTLEDMILKSTPTTHQKRLRNRALKKEYENNKQRLLKLERSNFEYILLIKTQDNWYKMLAHSAILFLYYVVPIAREKFDEDYRPPRLLHDSDFRYKSPIGVLTFKDLDRLKKIMYCCGFELVKVVDTEWITAFKLDRKMLEKEFWELVKQEEELWNKINRTIVPQACFPNLGVDIQETIKLIYDVVRKLPKDARELVGYKLLNLMSNLLADTLAAEKGCTSWDKFFTKAPKGLMAAQANITTMAAVRIEDKKILLRMAEAIKRVEDDVTQAKRMYDKTRKKQ